jgi:hypothetical protein
MNYANMILTEQQSFVDTLFGLEKYFILEHSGTGACKVLIPIGNVVRGGMSEYVQVDVVGSDNCGDQQRYYSYDVHGRFRTLEATGVDGRLHLAALYAATSSLLPDPRVGMTGDEWAMELLRQCFLNRPLSSAEREHVDNIPITLLRSSCCAYN